MKRKIAILLLFILIINMAMTQKPDQQWEDSSENSAVLERCVPIPLKGASANSLGYSDINNHWAKKEILEISALGYMEGHNGKFYPNRQLNYGEILTIAIRAIGKEGEAQAIEPKNPMKGIYEVSYKMGLIEKGKNKKVLTPAPTAKVTREEAANILGRALGIAPPMGHEIRQAKKFTDYKKIASHRLPYVELILQKGYMNGKTNKKFDPKSYITRGEFAKILSNANEDLIHYRNIVKKTGQVTEIALGNITIYNTDTTSNIIGYKGKDTFPIQKNKKIYNGDILRITDHMVYYLDQNGKAIYGEVVSNAERTIEGTIREINLEGREITVWDYNDKMHRFKLDPYIDMDELYFEQEVAVTSKAGQVVKITTFNEIDPERDGYIIPGTRFRVGTVLSATNQEIQIKTNSGIEKFQIDPLYTTLYKRNERVELFQLKEGDRVLLNFDDIYSPQVSEIKIEDEEKHIGGVIKGKIELVDERNKEVLISEPYKLDRGQWQPNGSKQKIKLGTGSIYEGGKKINLQTLNKRKGEEAYIAYENSYGNTNISKMLLKSGSSMEYKDKVQDVDYGIGQMLVDKSVFNVHEGTIVIKDNRLVDPLNIDTSQNVYLVSDYRYGARTASVVSIEDTGIIDDRIDGTKLWVYKGKIEDIFNYKLTLGKYNYKLDKEVLTSSGFVSNSGSEELTLSLDSFVYDSELKKQIPTNAFLDSRYIDLISIKDKELRDRVEKNHYKNKPAYVVAKETPYGKEILSINLVPQDLNSYNETVKLDNSTLGEIGEINLDTNTINLTKTRNYNNLTKRWEYTSDQLLNLDKAVILVNDRPLSLDELYKLKKGSKAYVVKHNDSAVDIPYVLLIEE